MKIERFFYSEAKSAWEQQLEEMHRRQEDLYLLENRSEDIDSAHCMEWICETLDESKSTLPADQPPVYTIANPKKYRQFKKVVNDAIELARAVRANLLVNVENLTKLMVSDLKKSKRDVGNTHGLFLYRRPLPNEKATTKPQ